MHITDAGRQYLEHCRTILSQVQAAEGILQSRHAAPQGRLAVTASVGFGRRYITPIANEFIQRYPDVTVDLLFIDRVVNLVEEGLDAAVRIGHLGDSSLIAIPLGKMRRVVCASPAYFRKHGTPRRPEDLRAHRCIRFTGLSPRGEWPFRVNTRRVAIPVGSVLTCNVADGAIEACAAGLGLGSFLSYMVAPLKQAGKLQYVLEEFENESLPVQLLYPHARILSTAVRAFADLCVAKLRQEMFD
jgi:DNA-binding transcriptional LysR family regulator